MLWHVVLLKPRADLPAAGRRRLAEALRRAVTAILTVRGVRFGRRMTHAGDEQHTPGGGSPLIEEP